MPTNLDRNEPQDDVRGTTPDFLPTTTPSAARDATSSQAGSRSEASVTALSDEEQAYLSLDDTVMQPLPTSTSLWEAIEANSRPPLAQVEPIHPKRIRTALLVGAVAAVSFVAGGITARLSTQMPVLFAEEPQAAESLASYVEPQVVPEATPAPVSEAVPTTDPEPDPQPTPPSYDTGSDTTDDEPVSPTATEDQADNDSTFEWTFDTDGNEKLVYNYNSDNVTIDYDGYSLTVPIGELIGYDQQTPDNERRYGDGTGYDTEEDRDRDSWAAPRGNGWYGGYHA